MAEKQDTQYVLTVGPALGPQGIGSRQTTHTFSTLDELCDYLAVNCEKGEVNTAVMREYVGRGWGHVSRIGMTSGSKMGLVAPGSPSLEGFNFLTSYYRAQDHSFSR